MSESFVNLNCTNCGAKLDVYGDMERFACGYCGTQMVVQRRGGTVALKALAEAIQKVQIGTDRTAAELALVRLEKEREELKAQMDTRLSVSDKSTGCGAVLLLVAAVYFIGQVSENPTFGVVGIVAVIAIVVAFFVKSPMNKDLDPVRGRLKKIDLEIDRNRKILEG